LEKMNKKLSTLESRLEEEAKEREILVEKKKKKKSSRRGKLSSKGRSRRKRGSDSDSSEEDNDSSADSDDGDDDRRRTKHRSRKHSSRSSRQVYLEDQDGGYGEGPKWADDGGHSNQPSSSLGGTGRVTKRVTIEDPRMASFGQASSPLQNSGRFTTTAAMGHNVVPFTESPIKGEDQSKLEESQRIVEDMTKSHKELVKQHEQLADKYQRLYEKNQEMKEVLRETLEKNKKISSDLKVKSSKASELDNKEKELKRDYERLEGEIRKKNSELKQLREGDEPSRQKIELLERTLGECQERARQREDDGVVYKEKSEKLEKAITDRDMENKELSMENKHLREEIESQRHSENILRQDFDKEKSRLRHELERHTDELKLKVQKKNETIADLNSKNQSHCQLISELQMKVAIAENTQRQNQDEISSLKSKIAEMHSQYIQLEAVNQELRDHIMNKDEELMHLSKELDGKVKKISKLKGKLQENGDEIDGHTETIGQLRSEIDQLLVTKNSEIAKNCDLENEIWKVKEENDKCKTDNLELSERLSKADEENERKGKQIELLEAVEQDHQLLKEKHQILVSNVDGANSEIDQLTRDLNKKQEIAEEVRGDLRKRDEYVLSLEKELDFMRESQGRELERMENEMGKMAREIIRLRENKENYPEGGLSQGQSPIHLGATRADLGKTMNFTHELRGSDEDLGMNGNPYGYQMTPAGRNGANRMSVGSGNRMRPTGSFAANPFEDQGQRVVTEPVEDEDRHEDQHVRRDTDVPRSGIPSHEDGWKIRALDDIQDMIKKRRQKTRAHGTPRDS